MQNRIYFVYPVEIRLNSPFIPAGYTICYLLLSTGSVYIILQLLRSYEKQIGDHYGGNFFHRTRSFFFNGTQVHLSKKREKKKTCKYKSILNRLDFPRHPYPTFQVHYRYRFQAPDHATYGVSWVSFNTEKLESYKWNYLDHYICMRGDSDFPLFDNVSVTVVFMNNIPTLTEPISRT